ncbi:MAG: hypothetical protein MJ192_03530 [Clostridia bacterium]|nr:hypothetical protein [Clostridia bacterium]
MKKHLIRLLVTLLTACMVIPPLAACRPSSDHGDESGTQKQDVPTDPAAGTEPDTEPATEPGKEPDPEPQPVVVPDGAWGKSIAGAVEKANAVSAYYTSSRRDGYHIENSVLSADYPFTVVDQKLLTNLKSPSGGLYLAAGLDVYVLAEDGTMYYASSSHTAARANIFRYGLYYYDVRILDQNFQTPGGNGGIVAEKEFTVKSLSFASHDASDRKVTDDVLSYTISGGDPYVYSNKKGMFKAEEYNALSVTIRTPGAARGQLYFTAGGHTGHSEEQTVHFEMSDNGEFNTYLIMLDGVKDYSGNVGSLRFDIDASDGDTIEITSVKAVKIASSDYRLSLDHTFHLYSDKLNSVAHVVSQADQDGVAAIGMLTKLPADTVASLVVKDAGGTHTSLDGVDWASAEYIGFDVKDAGVFGYILLPDDTSGTLNVTLTDGQYIITQQREIKGGRLYNNEAFYIGQRIYTDENHTFDAFLTEAEYERHPLTGIKENCFVGYDALRGAYTYKLGSTGFNDPYFNEWNHHYNASLTLTNKGDTDRTVYVLTTSTSGCLENAALLDERHLLLPIQPEVHKNFGGEKEEPLYNPGDVSYGETLFPLTMSAGQTLEMTVLNMYQNWGLYPLKQLSSIQYIAPYYHLSTGVTETSCIAPWYVNGRSLWTLPDFRPMSAPFWFEMTGEYYDNQPQHTHGGYQYFLQYTDAEGVHYASENIHNSITSVGPTYASLDMTYISDDGKIKVTYTHTEMPQTDEHRVYYEMKYEVLEDVSFKSFRNDFEFYSAFAYAGRYLKIGYLDEQNQPVSRKTNPSGKSEFVTLGSDCPYFALYNYQENSHNGFIDNGNNTNLGCSIRGWDLTVGGEKYTGSLLLGLANCGAHLTLDLDEVTLKKGDTMSINMVIGPWGWQMSEDDSNVQGIRADSCVSPLTVTAQKGTVTQTGFLPTLKTDDGKTAEFTLSGGSNNCTVRVYGFDKLTAPKLQEKVDGKWVDYDPSSLKNPDKKDNAHAYDGYAVYYDGDGTYSYSIVADMTNGSRTFRIDCSADFAGWEGEEFPEDENLPLKAYSDAKAISAAMSGNSRVGSFELLEEDDVAYTRVYGNGESPEAYAVLWRSKAGEETGRYIAIRYRVPKEVRQKVPAFEVFASTVNQNETAGDSVSFPMVQDGEWHVVILDMAANGPTYKAVNEKYYCLYARLDFFNMKASTDTCIDLSWMGIDDDLSAICALCEDIPTAELIGENRSVTVLETSSGGGTIHIPTARTPFGCAIDMINGIGEPGDKIYNNRGSGSGVGQDKIDFSNSTFDGGKLVISGWCMVEGGVDRYVFSADGGETWEDMTVYGRGGLADPGDAIRNAGAGKAGVSSFKDPQASGHNAVFQGPTRADGQAYGANAQGILADLSPYIGRNLTVLIGAVPAAAPDEVCVLVQIDNITVIP